jgi:hypothetical protein
MFCGPLHSNTETSTPHYFLINFTLTYSVIPGTEAATVHFGLLKMEVVCRREMFTAAGTHVRENLRHRVLRSHN